MTPASVDNLPVFGLVMTGGASTRMGSDKASITYHAEPQWRAAAEILRPLCNEVYWSCTTEQMINWQIGNRAIIDAIPGHGPASGLHAAFTKFTAATWMVLGCDYPNASTEDLKLLLAARSPDFDVITFSGDGGKNIEPMISLWEPAAQRHFLAAFSQGKDSPRRAILESRWRWVAPGDLRAILNWNTNPLK
ncbi:MAG: hypothetical protein RIQ81_1150 [Pseudomonadota bacterium]|jgi:molybdopterin-guanine dinucleotide biosynthesis protein A